MKRLSKPGGLAAALWLATAAVPAHATVAVFDFENQPIGTETPFSLRSAGVTATFAGPADVDPGAFGISSNFQTATGFQYRLMQGDFLTIGSAFGASGSALTIVFDTPVTAVSFAFALDDPAATSSLVASTDRGGSLGTGGALAAGYRYPEGLLSFSGAAFTTLTLRSTAIDFQIDNLQATTIAAVPEPASAWLLAAGVPLLVLARRRRA